MDYVVIQDPQNVGQKDRTSVDLSDLREAIETCKSDGAWQELTFTGKVRALIRERLTQLEGREEQVDQLIRIIDEQKQIIDELLKYLGSKTDK